MVCENIFEDTFAISTAVPTPINFLIVLASQMEIMYFCCFSIKMNVENLIGIKINLMARRSLIISHLVLISPPHIILI